MTASDLTKARLAHGMTQVELARVLGVSPATVSRMENGLVGLTTEHRVRVGALLASAPAEPRLPTMNVLGGAARHLAKVFAANGIPFCERCGKADPCVEWCCLTNARGGAMGLRATKASATWYAAGWLCWDCWRLVGYDHRRPGLRDRWVRSVRQLALWRASRK